MQTRLSNPKTIKFRSDLGFNQINLILKKRTISSNNTIKSIFLEKILENERVRTDMYFSEHKFVVEIDEKGNIDRNQNEKKRKTSKNRKAF